MCKPSGNSPLSNNSGDNNNGTLQSYAEFQGGPASMPGMSFQQSPIGYDSLNRLTSISDSGGWSRTYNYDQYGNMWVSNASGGPWSGITPTTNVYSGTTNRYTRPGWNYDASGNLKTLNGNNANYNAENQLTSLAATNGAGVTLAYDGLGQRVQKAISGTGGYTTIYAYDAFGRLASEYVGGSWSRDYIYWGTGQLIATENASSTPCTTCYFSYDHLGSVRLVTDQNHNVIARHDYLPFGEEIGAGQSGRSSQFGSTSDATQRFTGQVRDQESGEDYFNARYFSAALGRFNSPDPANAGADFLNPQSWNAYAYVLGNPLNSVDPTGMADDKPTPPVVNCPGCTVNVPGISGDVGSWSWWNSFGWRRTVGYSPSYYGGAPSGGGSSTQQKGSAPESTRATCPSSTMQKIYSAALASFSAATPGNPLLVASEIANKTGGTALFGFSASAAGGLPGAPQFSRLFSGQAVVAIDARGNIGVLLSGAVGGAAGEGLAAGADFGVSRASTIFDMAGPSWSLGFGGGRGFGGAVQISTNGGGTATVTTGYGIGGYAPSVSVGPTKVIPLVCEP